MPEIPSRKEMQEMADKYRQSELDKMTEEERDKFALVEAALKVLTDNNIPTYLFVVMPNSEQKNGVAYQYNNISHWHKEINGKQTKESGLKISWINHAFYYSLSVFLQGVRRVERTFPNYEDFIDFGKSLYQAVDDYRFWCQTHLPPKGLVEELKDFPSESEETV
jgi:hypothetical protein